MDTRPFFFNFWNEPWNEVMVKLTQALTTREVPEEKVSSVVTRDLGVHFGYCAAL